MVVSLVQPAWLKPVMRPGRGIYSLDGSDRDVMQQRFSMGSAASRRAKVVAERWALLALLDGSRFIRRNSDMNVGKRHVVHVEYSSVLFA